MSFIVDSGFRRESLGSVNGFKKSFQKTCANGNDLDHHTKFVVSLWNKRTQTLYPFLLHVKKRIAIMFLFSVSCINKFNEINRNYFYWRQLSNRELGELNKRFKPDMTI